MTHTATRPIVYKGIEYTQEHIAAMREWISDCQWPDLDEDDIAELSPFQILSGIERNVDGGLAGFITNMI